MWNPFRSGREADPELQEKLEALDAYDEQVRQERQVAEVEAAKGPEPEPFRWDGWTADDPHEPEDAIVDEPQVNLNDYPYNLDADEFNRARRDPDYARQAREEATRQADEAEGHDSTNPEQFRDNLIGGYHEGDLTADEWVADHYEPPDTDADEASI